MKKTFLAVMAVAAMLLSSCAKDYSAEIEELQNDVKDLKSKIENIQSSISNGAVVAAVNKTDNGIVIKMSDNKEYEITNGQNGAPGSVVDINEAGNWTIDGKDTGKTARAENGVNGDYYKPCTDKNSANFGKWILVDGTSGAETVTDSDWKTAAESGQGSGLTAVWDDDVLMLFGVQGYDDEYYEISFTSVLRAFSVFPTNWSSSFGLPCVTSYYMINPTIVMNVMCGNLAYPRLKDFNWQGGIEGFGYSRSDYSGFGRWIFGIAYATYLGMTDQKDNPDYNQNYDANCSEFTWQWVKERDGLANPGDIFDGIMLMCEYMAECFNTVENNTFIDFVPSTPISLTYRVIPMGAAIDGYKFSLLDHGINITKVNGEERDHAFSITGKVKYNKKDELTVTANTSYFKAMACTPLEFIRNYIKYDRYSDENEEYRQINDYVNEGAVKYLDAIGVSQAVMVNLEASTNGRGSEAIVSDGCVVKFEPFDAYVYYQNDGFNYVPLPYTGAPGAETCADIIAPLYESLDLGSRVALLDPMLGNATKYGFDVQWEYSIPEEYQNLASISSEGVITRKDTAVVGSVVPVFVTAHVMTPANGRFMVANEGIFYAVVR